MDNRTKVFINLLLVLQLFSFNNASVYEEASCQSYAGGSVYPESVYRRSEHKLQTTKAVSMYQLLL